MNMKAHLFRGIFGVENVEYNEGNRLEAKWYYSDIRLGFMEIELWSRVYENSVLDREDFFARKKKKELKGILKFNFLNFYLKCVENA